MLSFESASPMKRLFTKRKRKQSLTDEQVNGTKMKSELVDRSAMVPDLSESFARNLANLGSELQSYEQHKSSVLSEESKHSWDAAARSSASESELQAAAIILAIREHERDNLFGNKASEAIPGPETLDMGGQFLTNRQRIEGQSQLFKIAHGMPKGCHLHLHFNAELGPDRLIAKAKTMRNMFIRSTQPLLSPEDYQETEIVFEIKAADTPLADIFSADYKPDWKAPGSRPWMRWDTFQDQFAKRRLAQGKHGRDVDAEQWIQDKMILSEEEVYGIRQTTNG